MTWLKSTCPFLLLIFFIFKDGSSFLLTSFKSADNAILGNNTFTISCTYTLATYEALYSIQLQMKRETDPDFVTIVTYLSPGSSINVTYSDTALESRTVATKPTADSRTATLVFNQIVCNDKATYRWNALYTDGTVQNALEDLSFVVRAKTLFTENGRLTFLPNVNIEEGDKIVFTCTGDVGNEPVGHLGWFYYLNNVTSNAINASSLANPSAPVYQPDTCSYRRFSTLELTMTIEFNNILVRCTVQQDRFNQFGDGYVQTNYIPVYYSPKITAIEDKSVDEGTQSLTLICIADANPPPIYTWVLHEGTESDGPSYTLIHLRTGDSGTYTCVVYNTYSGVNHTVNETTYIEVQQSGDNTTIIITGVCVANGLLICIVIVVAVLCVRKRKHAMENEVQLQEPRHYEELTTYGYNSSEYDNQKKLSFGDEHGYAKYSAAVEDYENVNSVKVEAENAITDINTYKTFLEIDNQLKSISIKDNVLCPKGSHSISDVSLFNKAVVEFKTVCPFLFHVLLAAFNEIKNPLSKIATLATVYGMILHSRNNKISAIQRLYSTVALIC